jgi:hypothetical protein
MTKPLCITVNWFQGDQTVQSVDLENFLQSAPSPGLALNITIDLQTRCAAGDLPRSIAPQSIRAALGPSRR